MSEPILLQMYNCPTPSSFEHIIFVNGSFAKRSESRLGEPDLDRSYLPDKNGVVRPMSICAQYMEFVYPNIDCKLYHRQYRKRIELWKIGTTLFLCIPNKIAKALNVPKAPETKQQDLPDYPSIVGKLAGSKNFGPRYEIIEQIGLGAWAAVYKSRDKKTNQLVAVKIEPSFKMTLLANEKLKLMEIRTSPYVPDIIDYFPNEVLSNKESTVNILVMELLPCGSFENLKVDDCLQVGAAMFRCLQSIHALGVVHADISLGNFVKCESTVKLLDFGSARHVEEKDDPEGAEGSSEFTSAFVDTRKHAVYADDAEAVCFVIWRLIRDKPLPWAFETDDLQRSNMKSVKNLNANQIPKVLIGIITSLRSLSFGEIPDYNAICTQLDKKSVLERDRAPPNLSNEKLFRINPQLLPSVRDLPFFKEEDFVVLEKQGFKTRKDFARYYDSTLGAGLCKGTIVHCIEQGQKILQDYFALLKINASRGNMFAAVAASVWVF